MSEQEQRHHCGFCLEHDKNDRGVLDYVLGKGLQKISEANQDILITLETEMHKVLQELYAPAKITTTINVTDKSHFHLCSCFFLPVQQNSNLSYGIYFNGKVNTDVPMESASLQKIYHLLDKVKKEKDLSMTPKSIERLKKLYGYLKSQDYIFHFNENRWPEKNLSIRARNTNPLTDHPGLEFVLRQNVLAKLIT